MSAADPYARLRDEIVSGRLHPNERLVEADLTERLDTSRGAVRTALTRLAQDGLIEQERNRGARVRVVPEAEAVEILEARSVLEGLIARAAARRASPEEIADLRAILARMRARLDAEDLLGASNENAVLHARIHEISGHETATRLVASLKGQLVRFTFRTILVPGRSGRSFQEHQAIVDAIEAGDEEAAEAAMRDHLTHVTEAVRESATRAAAG